MATATLTSEPSIRKAAVLVRSLDPESVAALLSRLSPAEARAVRQAVRELDDVTDDDRRQVAQALRGGDSPVGVELQVSSDLPPYEPPLPTPPTRPAPPTAVPNPRLETLSQADPSSLVACLAVEQPSTIAVVLSCLPPARAADVLGQLPEELQGHAVDRLAEMGEIDPDSLDVIAAELESWIAQHTRDKRRRDDRRATLQAILDASPGAVRQRLGKQLAKHWPEFEPAKAATSKQPSPPQPPLRLPQRAASAEPPATQPNCKPATQPTAAAAIQRSTVPFAQLETLSSAQLLAVFAEVEQRTLLLALFGASEALLGRIRSTATPKQMRALEKSIAALGPVRLSDISHAQQVVGDAAAITLGVTGRAA